MNCHLQKLAKGIQIYSNNYDDILLMGYFNAEVTNTSFFSFCKLYEGKSIINQFTCYKNPTNPSSINLFLTNLPNSLRKSTVVETGLSDFHKLTVTGISHYSPKGASNIVIYRKSLIRQRQIYWWNFPQFTKAQFARINFQSFH